ncbi:heat shock protein 90 Hsp90 [Helicosporidium sp. ATCC 50920]|nr:heat shock protein 90 Hsp90 [Helicosporidium sp. ATCC 50920]|eukprot:KDD75133.1 heat shock protein 90 Hsp90 [Helicosporidium sp. ATCC 50920]
MRGKLGWRCRGDQPRQFSSGRFNSRGEDGRAEVNRMMDILINSLYSNKDIFLRELISNAADALDKIRFLSLTETDALAAKQDMKIQIWAEPEKNRLCIRDTGVGMTREDLVNNLGTIAKSGTSAFVEQMQKGGDLNLIGQFGVGFYSVYLVADYVEVLTKNNNDTQWAWESTAGGEFAISPDSSEMLGRGTQINVHLKPSQRQYLKEDKLKQLVARYSEFINFPISLLVEKEVEREVEEAREDKPESDDSADAAVEEEREEETSVRTVKEKVKEWEVLNAAQAVWLRSPSEISGDEYDKFYQALAKSDSDKPMTHTHFRAEGDVEFRAIMYVPPYAPPGLYDNYHGRSGRMRLYVRRVFISDSFEELLPKWLGFLIGLVDSDSMPLNVSREVLQMDDGLKVIRKKLVRKALDMLRKLSDTHREVRNKVDAMQARGVQIGQGDDGEEMAQLILKASPYENFWKHFGKSVKMGIIEEKGNRRRMLPLLRFQTTLRPESLTTLDDYVARMRPEQKHIYFLIGLSKAEVEASPFVETLKKRNLEVILFTDAMDEYMMGNLNEYEGHDFINVAKDDLRLDDDEASRKAEKAKRRALRPLTKWWHALIKGEGTLVEAVKVSQRLAERPCVVVSSKFGWSAQMERISMAQALSDTSQPNAHHVKWMRGSRTLEINPDHVVVRELKRRMEENAEDPDTVQAAHLLYEACLMESGFVLDDIKTFNERMLGFLEYGMHKPVQAPKAADDADEAEDKEAEDKEAGEKEAEEKETEEEKEEEHDEL